MSDDKVINRLLKLLALAEQGIGGEKTNAQRMLNKELVRHGLTVEDLLFDRTGVKEREFEFENEYEETILQHCIALVLDDPEVMFKTSQTVKNKLWIELSEVQFLDVELHYAIHKRQMNDLLKISMTAYITKNHIYPTDEKMQKVRDQSEQNTKKLKEKDLWLIRSIMGGIDRTHVRKGLANEK